MRLSSGSQDMMQSDSLVYSICELTSRLFSEKLHSSILLVPSSRGLSVDIVSRRWKMDLWKRFAILISSWMNSQKGKRWRNYFEDREYRCFSLHFHGKSWKKTWNTQLLILFIVSVTLDVSSNPVKFIIIPCLAKNLSKE